MGFPFPAYDALQCFRGDVGLDGERLRQFHSVPGKWGKRDRAGTVRFVHVCEHGFTGDAGRDFARAPDRIIGGLSRDDQLFGRSASAGFHCAIGDSRAFNAWAVYRRLVGDNLADARAPGPGAPTSGLSSSVPDAGAADDAAFDEADKIVWTSVVPAQVLAAGVALAIGPGITGKPSVFEGGDAGVTTTEGQEEGNNLEANAFGVGKRKFVPAVVLKAVAFIGDVIEAPGAAPIAFGASEGKDGLGGGRWLFQSGRDGGCGC